MAAPSASEKYYSCKGCDYNKEMFKRLKDGLATTLRDRCLQFLANNSSLLTHEDLTGMPNEILEDLKCFFCVHDLLKFESIFTECGISTNRVWEKHLCRRYRNAFRHYSFGQIFNIEVADNRCHSAQAVYMKLHCSQMLFPILSSEIDKRDCNNVCYHDLMFYLQFTPYLMLTIPRTSLLDNERALNILHTIKKYVKHIDFKQRGTLDISNCVVELIKYFRCNSSVTSLGFSLIRTSCDFKKGLYSDLTNECDKFKLMEGIKTSIGQYSYDFFSDDKCCYNGVNRLNVTLDECLTSSKMLNGLKHLTHLSIHGHVGNVEVINEIMEALNAYYRDSLKVPLKFLGFSAMHFHIVMDHDEILDLSYAVEEINLYECEFLDVHSKTGMLLFIQRNICLCRLNMLATDTSNLLKQNVHWNAIWSKSNLQSLTTPVDKYLQNGLHSMLDLSRNLTFLQIQWHPLWDQDVVRDGLSMLKCLNQLRTLVLRNNALGGFLPTILSSIFMNGEYPALRCLDMSGCHVKGIELITVAKSIWKTRGKHGRKLQVLDMSMNVLTRKQQEEINNLYRDLTEILLVEIADGPHAFSDV